MVRKNKRGPALWGTSLVPAELSGAPLRHRGENNLFWSNSVAGSTAVLHSHLVLKLSAGCWAVVSLGWCGEKHLVLLSQRKLLGGLVLLISREFA